MNPILRAEGVDLFYGTEQAVNGADFTLKPGEVAAIMGSSGSGKSSLLYCLAGVLAPSAGTVTFDGIHLGALPDMELSALRRTRLGFVFQYGELLPELTVEENAALPLRLAGISKDHAHVMAAHVLGRLGMRDLLQRRTSKLSGGQSQRVAVARALVHRPDVVFADEPTGALDSANAEMVLKEFLWLARRQKTAVVMVTHDSEVAAKADTQYTMTDGVLAQRVAV
ncbi:MULTISPECIES: ABC transporter ATP-binding protein [unclassified Streptomyces]|uniref:ABC transporter ATP-binding protein n=1 Tax=unclassified Streptomyces TaxID=2593676 RepID=UPI0016603410|nr:MULTISPECIES: ABC transporter ATP-binding protein [unclassified Streptomyces]MBD0709282.1 macrolide ABC transporter ATP-binding protein [Streptomyces sp. CBMA291]MBD0712628.1 macrolide ABC transporter ATP-binding protein [Streptomyces sp. CBMA370]